MLAKLCFKLSLNITIPKQNAPNIFSVFLFREAILLTYTV